MVLKPGTGSFGTVCRCQVLLENEICISHKVGQQQEAWSALKTSWYTAVLTLNLRKHSGPTSADDMAPPNHHWLWKLYTGPQATWFLCLSSLPSDSGTLISKGNAKFTFIREHNFGPLSSSPVLFVFSPGETLLTLSVVQEWLDTRNATAETHVLHTSVRSGSWSTDSSCSSLFVNLPPHFWMVFFTILSRVQLSLLLVHFFYHIFSFPSPLY